MSCASAIADPISITNSDFEIGGDSTGWTTGALGAGSGQFYGVGNFRRDPGGAFQQGLRSFTPAEVEADANGADGDASVEQVLTDVFDSGTEYTLTAFAGSRPFVFEDFSAEVTSSIELFDSVSGEILAKDSLFPISNPTGGTWNQLTAVGIAEADNAGHAIGIRLIQEITNLPNGPGQVQVNWDEIALDAVAGVGQPASFQITDFVLNGNDTITVTWESITGKVYSLFASTDLVTFDHELSDSVNATGASTSFTFPVSDLKGSTRNFIRVSEN